MCVSKLRDDWYQEIQAYLLLVFYYIIPVSDIYGRAFRISSTMQLGMIHSRVAAAVEWRSGFHEKA